MRFLLVAAIAVGWVSPVWSAENAVTPKLTMKDQFGDEHDLAKLRGHVVALVFSDRGGAEASRDLGAQLHVHFHPSAEGKLPAEAAQAEARPIAGLPVGAAAPDAKVIAVAVIGEVPQALHGMIRFRFRQVSPDAAIWLDMTDSMRKQLQVKKDVPNVAVLDVQGRLRYTVSGNLNEAQFAELAQVIEALRIEGLRAN